MNPFKDLSDAITLPLTALWVIPLCAFVDWMTSPGHWWVQWVVFGMGIAVLCAWARAIKLLLIGGLLAGLGAFAYRHRGDAGRARIAQWLQATPPPPPHG